MGLRFLLVATLCVLGEAAVLFLAGVLLADALLAGAGVDVVLFDSVP